MAQVEMADVVEQIKNEIEVDVRGRGKASIRATARLAGVDDKSLRAAFEGAEQTPSQLAKKLMEQGFTGAEQALWGRDGIPDIAIAIILEYYALDAGRYAKEQAKLAYKAFATIGIRTWMQQIKGWEQHEKQAPQSQLSMPTLEEISTLLDLTLGKTGLNVKLVAGAKLDVMGKRYPHLLPEVEQAKAILLVSVDEVLLTPKQLAEIIQVRIGGVWNSEKVNNFLTAQGFQVRNPDGNPDYLPTNKGKAHSRLVLSTTKGCDETVQYLRWFETVLEVLKTGI